jgi:transposase
MPRYRTAYPREFRRQLVDLVRSGGTPEELARELEPTAQSILQLGEASRPGSRQAL